MRFRAPEQRVQKFVRHCSGCCRAPRRPAYRGVGGGYVRRAAGEGLFLAAANDAVGQARFARGRELARSLLQAMPASSPLPARIAGSAPFKLLEQADAPGLFLETGFLSNADAAAALGSPDKRQALAQALADALLAALRGVKMPPAAGRG